MSPYCVDEKFSLPFTSEFNLAVGDCVVIPGHELQMSCSGVAFERIAGIFPTELHIAFFFVFAQRRERQTSDRIRRVKTVASTLA